ncbi:HEPN domain-containing protein [Jiella endophytica]|uniref:HEPN domain-containing protein n=1 Tax=Jiella endophytica TaxID=2558362 RepID=A0A4Y8RMV2_9HYPH|nr:HEPN domain-containing protein [Jiella endophytica]TFF24918.1 HEPN domain-containing protein [Jiella endophytica]
MSAGARAWIAKAEADIDAVRRSLEPDPDINEEIAAYHLQQAAEKLLKAALVHLGIAYPRGSGGHDLRLCANLLPPGFPLNADARALVPMSPWGTAYRYPDDDPVTAAPLPTDAELEAASTKVAAFRIKLLALLDASSAI